MRFFSNLKKFWKKFCTESKEEYGKPYKIIFQKGTPPSPIFRPEGCKEDATPQEMAKYILNTLYPSYPIDEIKLEKGNPTNDLPITKEEITQALNKTNDKKAPGYDGIDVIILKNIHATSPDLLTIYFNKCLSFGYFPTALKKGILLLFHKEDKPKGDIYFYRPTTLLPTIGKRLEKIITARISFQIESKNLFSEKQHGFREGKSTTTALINLIETNEQHKQCFEHILAITI